jgi:purine-nucleoside phosphorylase
MSEYVKKINAAADYIRRRIPAAPRLGLVLGSGWNMILEDIQSPVRIPYAEVPGMVASTVPGHAGEWVFGKISGRDVCVMSGRVHYYEGYSLKDVTLPIRVMKALGVERVVLTNAAGAVNKGFEPGDMMLITDHINLTAANPLTGPNDDDLGTRFPDMSRAYDREMQEAARSVAREQGTTLREGVYMWLTGPTFETPAEIRMARTLGADAVGMSTVPEVIAARHGGTRVLALSCMTNMAAGVLDQPLSHAEVLETANRVRSAYRPFVARLIELLS